MDRFDDAQEAPAAAGQLPGKPVFETRGMRREGMQRSNAVKEDLRLSRAKGPIAPKRSAKRGGTRAKR